jgi:hypothetical protein
VKPYCVNKNKNKNKRTTDNEKGELNENNDTPTDQTTEPPQRNPERSRQLPARFRQNYADVSVFLGNHNPRNSNNDKGKKSRILLKKPPQASFVESRRKEIDSLLERGAFEFVSASTVPKGTRIFGS